MRCVVKGCRTSSNGNQFDKISQHGFPEGLMESVWTIIICAFGKTARKGGEWHPTKASKVCGLHFEKECFESGDTNGLRRLKKGAIPTKHLFTPLGMHEQPLNMAGSTEQGVCYISLSQPATSVSKQVSMKQCEGNKNITWKSQEPQEANSALTKGRQEKGASPFYEPPLPTTSTPGSFQCIVEELVALLHEKYAIAQNSLLKTSLDQFAQGIKSLENSLEKLDSKSIKDSNIEDPLSDVQQQRGEALSNEMSMTTATENLTSSDIGKDDVVIAPAITARDYYNNFGFLLSDVQQQWEKAPSNGMQYPTTSERSSYQQNITNGNKRLRTDPCLPISFQDASATENYISSNVVKKDVPQQRVNAPSNEMQCPDATYKMGIQLTYSKEQMDDILEGVDDFCVANLMEKMPYNILDDCEKYLNADDYDFYLDANNAN